VGNELCEHKPQMRYSSRHLLTTNTTLQNIKKLKQTAVPLIASINNPTDFAKKKSEHMTRVTILRILCVPSLGSEKYTETVIFSIPKSTTFK
jgi:hypothetical protein